MTLKNWWNKSRNLGAAGSALLAAGIAIYIFFGGTSGHLHDWAHAVGGFFMGISIILLLRAVWLNKNRGEVRACGTEANQA
jgi:Na+/proline symporter